MPWVHFPLRQSFSPKGSAIFWRCHPYKVPKFQYFLSFLKYSYSFNLFLALRTTPASADRNVFRSTSTFPDESIPFLFPEEVVTGTKQDIYSNAGRYQHICL